MIGQCVTDGNAQEPCLENGFALQYGGKGIEVPCSTLQKIFNPQGNNNVF
jgi:hypothetical protein